ncbi:hypothetical protein C4D60_Mb07t12400 [Musa balbisiana]|uniref:Saposin B-type domain-containing protein n=1 Tax=Musa balbisiana TaxID=52838 RepID=A0A4S8JF15_MUSBA|nr:hypothetical protein C4D60_Mb07t12400 [Musa balbisiana]
MEMKTVTCFIILFVTLAHVDARLGLDPTMMDQGNMDSYMEEQPQESACGSCLEASQRAKKALDDLETFGELQRLCLPLPSDIKDKCLERSSAYIRQTKLLLRDHLFDQENLCKSTGQCTDESMSPRKDAITPLLTESAKVEECGECSEAVKQIFAGLQTPRMILKPEEMCGMLGFCPVGIPL